MYNLNPNAYALHEQTRQDRMRQAEQHRLAECAKQANKSPSSARKSIARLGTFLVTLGNAMQAQTKETHAINTISRPVS